MVVIFLAKQGHCAFGFCRFEIHDVRFNRQVATDLRIHQIFNSTDFSRLHRFGMREVEAQQFIVNQRAFLCHMCAQNLAQRRVHQMRCGVVQANTRTTRFIHISLYCITNFQRTRRQLANVTNGLAIFLCVANGKRKTCAFQFTLIANLTTRLRIERRLIQYDNSVLTSVNCVYRFTINKQRGDFAVQFQVLVAFKFRSAINTNHCIVVCAKTAGFTCATALFFHCSFKASFINLNVTLAANVCRQVNRETVSVIQTECGFAVQRIARQFCQFFIQQRQTTLQRTRKLLFFGFQNLLNHSLLTLQFFTSRAHDVHQRTNQLVEEGILRAQHVAMTYRAANDTAQHIATVFIRRHNTIGNQERTGTDMVGDNAQRLVAQIGRAGDFRHGLNQ